MRPPAAFGPRRGGLAIAVVVAIALLWISRVAALAIDVPSSAQPLPGSQFQGADGDQANAPGLMDWQGLVANGRVRHAADPGASDNIFASSKERSPDGWSLTAQPGGANPASGNILDTYQATDRAPNGDLFLYLAFTREASNGTVFASFDLNQDPRLWTNSEGERIPCRTSGDVLISFEPHGNGESVRVERWVTDTSESGCARTGHLVSATDLTANLDVQGSFNTGQTDIANFLPGSYDARIPELRFGEAAINLSRVIHHDFGQGCTDFASIWMHTRASTSVNAALKDYVAPLGIVAPTCRGTPSLSSSATRHHLEPGAVLRDTASLRGGTAPTGTITFQLFGPGDSHCSRPPVFTSSAAASGNGRYRSGDFTSNQAGVYRWVVGYSGDQNNHPAGPTRCGTDSETATVTRAQPDMTTSASGGVMANHPVWDSATLSGGQSPTGAITFRLYGPRDPTCSRRVFSSRVPVSGNGVYFARGFTPSAAGIYHWTASYSGDGNNEPAGPGRCLMQVETAVVRRARPHLDTLASPSVVVGAGHISDSALLAGGSHPAGSILFRLFRPGDRGCRHLPLFRSRVPVSGAGPYESATFSPRVAGIYRWRASYSGDRDNRGAGPSGCDAEPVVVATAPRTQPTLTTAASPGGVGSPIRDTATLSGSNDASGQIQFALYGPGDDSCTGPPVFTDETTVAGDGQYGSPPFTPNEAGVYQWVAHYEGDRKNEPVAGSCGDEPATVSRSSPALTTTASKDAALGGTLHDTAALSGAADPTGTITFTLFGPDDPTCAAAPAFTTVVVVNANGTFVSPSFAPSAAGAYGWVASYSGDADNAAAATSCDETTETASVGRAAPLLTTSVNGLGRRRARRRVARSAGLPLHDTAYLTGVNPGGQITFELYGPGDASCSQPAVFTTATAVNGAGTYNSQPFDPSASGTYRWVARYSGDSDNLPAGPTACADVFEQATVTLPATPALSSSASTAVTVGGAISDTAHLSGGTGPGGALTFHAYGPVDIDCSGAPAFTSARPVAGNGDYSSAPFTPSTPGVYRWRVTYSGDSDNHGVGPTGCANSAESSFVRPPDINPALTSLSSTAAPANGVGAPIFDIAHLSGGVDPGGAITFQLFGPGDATCTGKPAFTDTASVIGNADYRSGRFIPVTPGTYRWVATYPGDANNIASGPTACGDPAETVTISATPGANPSHGPTAGIASAGGRGPRAQRPAGRRETPRFTG